MARALYILICCAIMIGLGIFAKDFAHRFSEDNVISFALGAFCAIVLYYFAQKVEQRQRDRA
jgi:hypothetical protein